MDQEDILKVFLKVVTHQLMELVYTTMLNLVLLICDQIKLLISTAMASIKPPYYAVCMHSNFAIIILALCTTHVLYRVCINNVGI